MKQHIFLTSFSLFILSHKSCKAGFSRRLIIGFSSLLVALVVCLLPVAPGLAAVPDGTVDPTFKSGSGPNSTVYSLAVQNDGKILVGGGFVTYDGKTRHGLARLNPDGTLDTSFNPGPSVPEYTSHIYSLAVQSDGKILVAGSFNSNYFNGPSPNPLFRLNPDGSLDASFNSGGTKKGDVVYNVTLQNDGKILIIIGYNNITRLNVDGSLDTSFRASGLGSGVSDVALQSDGKLLVGSSYTSPNGTVRNGVVRLNVDGSLDASFDVGTAVSGFINHLAIQNDGKVIIAGIFSIYNGESHHGLIRLNVDGSLDASFSVGLVPTYYVYSIVVRSNGKILIGGGFTLAERAAGNRIAQLNSDGSVDSSFGMSSGADDNVQNILVQSDGKILIGGKFTSYNEAGVNRTARLNPDGTLDTSFNNGTGVTGEYSRVNSMAVQSDGKILVGGYFTRYNGASRNSITRLNPDGTLDTSFNPGDGVYYGSVYSIAVQNDGKILIGGPFSRYNGTDRSGIARLNPDGSLDTSFNPGTGTNNYPWESFIKSIAVQNDGKIIIGGQFITYNGVYRYNVARLNSDGSLDTNFNSHSSYTVNSLAVQNDDKIIIGGHAMPYDSGVPGRVDRLNTDGSPDTSFKLDKDAIYNGYGLRSSSVSSLALQSDGKIVFGQNFTHSNNLTFYLMTRLNNDGSLDTSFSRNSWDEKDVNTVAVQSDGKILLGGSFSVYNQTPRQGLARLNSDGSLDTSFTTSVAATGVPFAVNSLVLQNDGKILLGGYFDRVDTFTRNNIARLENAAKIAPAIALTSNVNPAALGQSVTFTATLTPLEATGTLTFTFANNTGSTSVARPLVNGVATYTTATLPPGDTAVTVSYSGNSTFAPSSSLGYNQHVGQLSLSSSVNPAVTGANITFKASVQSPIAKGLVTFTFTRKGQTTSVTTRLTEGVASYMTTTLPSGSYTVTANYAGNAGYPGSFAQSFTQHVVANCADKIVTNPTDDGEATTCGTLSYALATTTDRAITLALSSGNTVTFTGDLRYPLAAGVTLDGGENGLILDGNGVAGDGLRLSGGNTLANLTIRNFGGRELIATAAGSTPNQLFKVKIES